MPSNRVYAFGEPENDGERRVIRHLDESLPLDGYNIYHNLERQANSQTYEWDVIVLAPHALFCLEVKDWPGRVVGNDRECVLNNGAIRENPYPLLNKKSKILKSRLTEKDAFLRAVWVEPIVVIADMDADLDIEGDSRDYIATLANVVAWITDNTVGQWAGKDHRGSFAAIEGILTDDFRPMTGSREVAHFRLVEQLRARDLYTEWRAENKYVPSAPPVRLKIYAPDPYLPTAERTAQMELIRRDFEASSRLGSHPNLVPPRDFFPEEGGRYVLVSDDLACATLSASMIAGRSLTFEQKIQVIEEIAAGLAHAHSQGIIHRDVRPENIYLRTVGAALVNFDCARIANAATINSAVQQDLDPRYLSPEVRVSPANVTGASDVYALGLLGYELLTGKLPSLSGAIPAPSTVDPLVDSACDQLIQKMLAAEAAERPVAADVRDALADLRDRRRAPSQHPPAGRTAPSPEPASLEFRIGDTIDSQYLVRDILGEGSFGKVYRVYSPVTDREYAMKIFRDPGLGLEDAQQEFAALAELSHPRIAHVWHAARLHQGTYYLLTNFIEGRPLHQLLTGSLPAPRDAIRIVASLLEALAYLHSQAYVHRDIKPSNVIRTANGAVLIDFSTALRPSNSRTVPGGTPLYAPPDIASCELTPGRDLYAAGVILFELLTGTHPYGGIPLPGSVPRDPCAFQPRLSPPLTALLQRAVAPEAAHRYHDAAGFLTALNAIEEPLIPLPAEYASVGGITIPEEERIRPNYNPYLTRFLTLYSQNRYDNSGTRGYDEVSRATYVRTLLDKRLAPDILEGRLRLVFITGNAGDGKTAFLQSLEEDLAAGRGGPPQVSVQRLPSGNGAVFTLAGRGFQTNYDGSQDEGDQQNDDVLADFFAPYAGTEAEIAARPDNLTRLIAINEGKLRDFLAHRRVEFPWLAEALLDHLDTGRPLPEGYAMVNLNERSVVTGAGSILARQIESLCNPAFWEPCRGCVHAPRCPVKANVDTLNHADLGPRVRQRLERLFEIVHLRGGLHLTMRAVRSALAYVLFGEEDCSAIAARLESADSDPNQVEGLLRKFYYNAIAAISPETLDTEISTEETDRLLRLLSEADPGLGANPGDDRNLHYQGLRSELLPEGIGLAGYDRDLLQALMEQREADISDPESLAVLQRLHAVHRRKAFFERPDDGWEAMLPYTQLHTVLQACHGDEAVLATLKTTILQGINSGEGLGDIADRLTLRVAHGTPGRVRSYRQFPGSDFRLQVPRPPLQPMYIEHFPAYLELVYRPGANGAQGERPTLRLGLDMVELLGRMARGYAPTTAEWRGPLVNLLVFRTLLAHEPYDQLLLVDTMQERRFHVKQTNGQIALVPEETAHAAL